MNFQWYRLTLSVSRLHRLIFPHTRPQFLLTRGLHMDFQNPWTDRPAAFYRIDHKPPKCVRRYLWPALYFGWYFATEKFPKLKTESLKTKSPRARQHPWRPVR